MPTNTNFKHRYSGSFDGINHTITGLTVTGSNRIENRLVSGSVSGRNTTDSAVGYNPDCLLLEQQTRQ
ncbi:hypothetical protein [uncultured Alistipes sp.]|uniref:hypothetical protein n=1 Tax=uncultured Alistipes sp. TaxID=538949 RepID=UPI00266D928C|nr:hypothetical protein [uncultured Alistipes sp.]